LSASQEIELCARRLLVARQSDESATESISPRTLAAAALHTAFSLVNSNHRPTLSEIAEVIDVSESTISKRKGDLLQYQDDWQQATGGE
jgi:transcription initiation factor TFIIIB Brf1 subunit/transcription initiation factor TFIIB